MRNPALRCICVQHNRTCIALVSWEFAAARGGVSGERDRCSLTPMLCARCHGRTCTIQCKNLQSADIVRTFAWSRAEKLVRVLSRVVEAYANCRLQPFPTPPDWQCWYASIQHHRSLLDLACTDDRMPQGFQFNPDAAPFVAGGSNTQQSCWKQVPAAQQSQNPASSGDEQFPDLNGSARQKPKPLQRRRSLLTEQLQQASLDDLVRTHGAKWQEPLLTWPC